MAHERGAPAQRWDVFCSVVDNFGDAGVAWRLARALAHEHERTVRLWIDQPRTLARLVPGLVRDGDVQHIDGIEVHDLAAMSASIAPADAVVEAFGCGLPEAYVARMVAQPAPAQWFVLEYLTAEPWAESVHGVASPHPRLPLVRRFWCPGFTRRTGGLLRERDLFDRRERFRANGGARDALARDLGTAPRDAGALNVSLFCYPNAPVGALLEAWSANALRVRCLLPEGVAHDGVRQFLGVSPKPGAPVRRGRLEVHAVPFLPQDRYDELLWDCDLNFVRGEDSFVRAQWAARPLVWHIYPQSEAAHLDKLQAFLRRYAAGLDNGTAEVLRRFVGAWNGAPGTATIGRAWPDFAAALPRLASHARGWAGVMAGLPELATTLVEATCDAL